MSVQIAIDGPAGSGKSTLARGLATILHLPYVNTGLMYRALTRHALDGGLDLEDGKALAALARTLTVDLDLTLDPPEILIDGRRPGPELTAPEVEGAVSLVSSHLAVRAVLVEQQRRLGQAGAVMEGRDIGRVVLPDAPVKIYLDAVPVERAGRRAEERGNDRSLADELARRDALDSRTNPFIPAPDAVRLDNSGRTVDETLREALRLVREGLGEVPA
jgi:cytidylate kinase